MTNSSRAGPSRGTRSTNGSGCPPGRLCDYSGMSYDADRGAWRHPVAVSGAAAEVRLATTAARAALRRRPCSRPTTAGAAHSDVVGAVSRAAERGVPAGAEHGPHGRALAHPHQNRRGADSRAAVAPRLARDEPARRAGLAAEGDGRGGRRSRDAGGCGSLELRLTETVAPGQVFVPFHWASSMPTR